MKKIGNFTQTYQANYMFSSGVDGKDREFLIDYMLKDKCQVELRSFLDIHTYTFHNYDEAKAKNIAHKIKAVIPSTRCILYNNMTLGQSILSHLQFLKSQSITDVLWIQDDEYFVGECRKDLLDFFAFYKIEKNIKNVSLCYKKDDLTKSSITDYITVNKNLNLFKTSVIDFIDSGKYAMDFSAFICDIDILLNIFEEIDLSSLDAYKLEGDFSGKAQSNNVPRYVLNKPLFKTYNVVGMPPSLGQADQNLLELKKKFDT
jgi:hypothetical protein